MSLIHLCTGCDARVLVAHAEGVPVQYDAPEKGILEEMAPGRPMMPDSLRLIIFGRKKAQVMPRNVRALYLNIHRCGRR